MGGYHITTIIEMSRRAAGCRQLNWRTLVTTVRTEHAAIARLRTQQNAAALAVEEIHARIRRHALHRRMSALGACQKRSCLDDRCHFCVTVDALSACRRFCTLRANVALTP